VQVGDRDTVWPEFVFVTTQHGEGWMPARYLSSRSGSEIATVLRPYDTSELNTQVGDELEVLEVDEPGGWLWCRSTAAAEGWIPSKTVTGLD